VTCLCLAGVATNISEQITFYGTPQPGPGAVRYLSRIIKQNL
jgi:hypothetical protein